MEYQNNLKKSKDFHTTKFLFLWSLLTADKCLIFYMASFGFGFMLFLEYYAIHILYIL